MERLLDWGVHMGAPSKHEKSCESCCEILEGGQRNSFEEKREEKQGFSILRKTREEEKFEVRIKKRRLWPQRCYFDWRWDWNHREERIFSPWQSLWKEFWSWYYDVGNDSSNSMLWQSTILFSWNPNDDLRRASTGQDWIW